MTSSTRPPPVAALFAALAVLIGACSPSGPADRAAANLEARDPGQVYAYLVHKSFVGASGGLIVEDGQTFSFDAELGTRTGVLSSRDVQRLREEVADADFFELPAELNNPEIMDGNSVDLMVASATRSHRSSNYMHDDSDFGQAERAIVNAAPAPRSNDRCYPPETLEREVRAYLQRMKPSEKANTVRRWLDEAKALLDQHASSRAQHELCR